MEDIEVNTNINTPDNFKKPNEIKTSSNILFKPTFNNLEMEEEKNVNRTNLNQSSVLNRSSMMTYSKMYFSIYI